MKSNAQEHNNHDNRKGYAERRIHIKHLTIEAEPRYPKNNIKDIDALLSSVGTENEVIRQKYSRHRCENGTDEVQKRLELSGIGNHRQDNADDAGNKGRSRFGKRVRNGLAANAGGQRIEKRSRNRRQENNYNTGNTHTGLGHNTGQVVITDIKDGTHTNEKHPAA